MSVARWPAPLPLPKGDVATGLLLLMAHRMSNAVLAAALGPLDFRIPDFGVLTFLAEAPLSQKQLIDMLGVDKSTMVRMMDELEARGLATRKRDSQDRRAYALEITEVGRLRLEEAHEAATKAGQVLFGGLSTTERGVLDASLHKIIEAGRTDVMARAKR